MNKLVCINCDYSEFLNPAKEICWKTGGLYCRRFKTVVGKYEGCLEKTGEAGRCGKGGEKGIKGLLAAVDRASRKG